jgi:uncharacterized membrane protein
MNLYYIIGAILLAIGLIINYSINRRRFNRRGVGGLQQFDSYGKAVVTTWLERFGKLIAIILIIFGIGILFLGHDKKAQQNIVPKAQQKE